MDLTTSHIASILRAFVVHYFWPWIPQPQA
jgi:hypothetical protein